MFLKGFSRIFLASIDGFQQLLEVRVSPHDYNRGLTRYLFFLLVLMRIGEATNPGPDASPWRLGFMNPTGLQGKETLLRELDSGIYGVAETHLTSLGLQKVRRSLHFAQTGFSRILHGCPATARAHSTVVGRHEGVAFLSDVPCRPIPDDMPKQIWQTARVHVAGFLQQNVWMQGAVIYGYASAVNHTSPLVLTNQLVEQVVQRIGQDATGPRFIMGDFNASHEELPGLQILRSLGFRELQDVAAERWGFQIQPTCKMSTRPDQIYISMELQHLLRKVEVIQDLFADHAVLVGEFASISSVLPRTVWHLPKRDSWQAELGTEPLPSRHAGSQDSPTVDERYGRIFQDFESQLNMMHCHQRACPWPRTFQGRAQPSQLQVRRSQVPPVKKARPGDANPEFFGPSLLYTQWFRQLRRLQMYVRLVDRNALSVPQRHQQQELWKAICRAPGFGFSFEHWWAIHGPSTGGHVTEFSTRYPPWDEAHAMFEFFRTKVKRLEQDLRAKRVTSAHRRRADNPVLIFKDLKESRADPVEVLLQTTQVEVEEISQDESAIVLKDEVAFDPDKPLVGNGQQFTIIHAESDKVWVHPLPTLHVGQVLRQEVATGDLASIFQAFGKEWSRWWHRHSDDTLAKWDDFLAEMLPLMPHGDMDLPPITLEIWRKTVRAKKVASATGPDGISRLDLLQLPDPLTLELIQICEHAESTGEWPTQAMTGLISALAKVPGAQRVQQFRPITILSMVYRVWSTIRARQALAHVGTLAGPRVVGNIPGLPGQTAGQIWFQLQTRIEQSHLFDKPLLGIVADLVKAFNVLPRLPTWALCHAIGIHANIIRAWSGAVVKLQRRFCIRGAVGPALLGTNGFPEGDPLSCLAMASVAIAFDRWMMAKVPVCRPLSYVDNWEITADSPEGLGRAVTGLQRFAAAFSLDIDWSKTYIWATHAEHRKQIRSLGLLVRHSAKDLGGNVFYTKQHTTKMQADRFRSMDLLWGRLRVSLAPFTQKLRALKVAAWPRALHACSSVRITDQQFTSIYLFAGQCCSRVAS